MADFIAGYISGAISILVGNPLDVLKTRLQASSPHMRNPASALNAPASSSLGSPHATTTGTPNSMVSSSSSLRSFGRDALRGIAAPVVSYGALNAVLFATYNRTLIVLDGQPQRGGAEGALGGIQEGYGIRGHPYWIHFAAGCLGGLATFAISAPTEVVKCRAQVVRDGDVIAAISPPGNGNAASTVQARTDSSSLAIAKHLWRTKGIKGFYHGGTVTALRDSIGYGFYYLSYELAKDGWDRVARGDSGGGANDVHDNVDGGGGMLNAVKILLCGGLAGVVTWASVFPLDVVKTRVQTQDLAVVPQRSPSQASPETVPLVSNETLRQQKRLGAWKIAKLAYRNEGVGVFFRGLSVCCARAFVVNAVQWAVYEWVMSAMADQK